MARPRTAAIDMTKDSASTFFDKLIPAGSCAPAELFKLVKINQAGRTSDLHGVSRWQLALGGLLELTDGRIPRHRQLHKQFGGGLETKRSSGAITVQVESQAKRTSGRQSTMHASKLAKEETRRRPITCSV